MPLCEAEAGAPAEQAAAPTTDVGAVKEEAGGDAEMAEAAPAAPPAEGAVADALATVDVKPEEPVAAPAAPEAAVAGPEDGAAAPAPTAAGADEGGEEGDLAAASTPEKAALAAEVAALDIPVSRLLVRRLLWRPILARACMDYVWLSVGVGPPEESSWLPAGASKGVLPRLARVPAALPQLAPISSREL